MRRNQIQRPGSIKRAIAAAALGFIALAMAGASTVHAVPKKVGIDEQVSALRADPLLAVDLNRNEIVDRLATQWQAELAASEVAGFRQKLASLRADRLLAASLVGSFDAVLNVLYREEKIGNAQSAISGLALANGSDRSKGLGDPDKNLVYTPLVPCRLIDTRVGAPSAMPLAGGTFAANSGRDYVPNGACLIPGFGVKSLFVTVTTLNNTPNSGGYLAMVAALAPVTTVVEVFNIGTQWNSTNTILSTSSSGAFFAYVAAANAEIVVDVLGHFSQPSSTGIGLRVLGGTNQPTIVNGDSNNGYMVNTDPVGMTIAGGNNNLGGSRGVTISGGTANRAGNPDGVKGKWATVAGGANNRAGSEDNSTGDYATVGGGYLNQAIGDAGTIAGGLGNVAYGYASTVPGGLLNTALGNYSFAAGLKANAVHQGSFVWGDTSSVGSSVDSTGPDQFVIRAAGGVRLNPATRLFFEPQSRQMVNLGGSEVGIGVQSNTQYNRTYGTAGRFCWFKGGVHTNTECDPGAGGSTLMNLSDTELRVNGVVVTLSDRNSKENFGAVNAKAVLAQVIGLPLSAWNYKSDEVKSRHIGPMAQDFKRAFGLGNDDKSIATTDVSGVALAAIQGLHQVVKEKDAKIAAMQRELDAIKKKLGMP